MNVLYEAFDLPTLQNRVFATADDARKSSRGDVRLVQDDVTGLIYNAAFDPAKIIYDENYQNEQANSAAFQRHLDGIADLVMKNLGSENLVEIGCGKGYFLEKLAARGCKITGCDPTYEGSNPAIIKEFFGAALGLPKQSGLILRHVLEHIQDPMSFLSQVRDSNGGGLIYIEVPCFDWIAEHKAWFDVFYEHVNYFRLDDFRRAFGKLLFAERTFNGQYLSIIGDLSTLRAPHREDAASLPSEFSPDLADFVSDAVLWGAASKGVILSIALDRAKKPVKAVIDINPAKQGKYLPVAAAQVVAPEAILPSLADGTMIYVMNGNYLDEIKAKAGARFRYSAIDRR